MPVRVATFNVTLIAKIPRPGGKHFLSFLLSDGRGILVYPKELISKGNLVYKDIPAEYVFDFAALEALDVVVKLEGLRTALAVAVSVYGLLL